jgi:asparagine synthase (glutamine-hydrolysing)
MCGITGFLLPETNPRHPVHQFAEGGLLHHRGPDAFGYWFNAEQTVGLQHYRLAILDLSPAGAQPMLSADGRYVIAFNGEIYNHVELRSRLESEGLVARWRGGSDTETLLAGISAWGLDKTLKACVGMFAIALYDRAERCLTLARDRLGEKPLYYGFIAGAFCFASEPKAFRSVIGGGSLRLNASTLAAYMRLGYVPGAQSIYEDILRLSPGCTVTINSAEVRQEMLQLPQSYWSASDLPERCGHRETARMVPEVLDGLDNVLRNAVKEQMHADVPLGALLSGGIDSSLVVSMMQAQSLRPVRTFSVGLIDNAVDEAPYARRIAARLGTDHTELYVSPKDALDLIPRLPGVFCEPFADSSQIPTLLISQMARQSVKVVLTGDGGDELFGGYDRYFRVSNGWRIIEHVPVGIRRRLGNIAKKTPAGLINSVACLLGNPGGLKNPADRVYKIADAARSETASELNERIISLWDPSKVIPGIKESESIFTGSLPSAPTLIEQLMLADTLCYLPDDLLVKVDRASMAVSLESRSPFLDHRVVEYAWSLPLGQKIINGEGKAVLKLLLERYMPRELFERPKQGFGLPIDDWLRGPLKEWAEDLLSPEALQRCGLFEIKEIQKKWREHTSGERNWHHHLWNVLMFQAWLYAQ